MWAKSLYRSRAGRHFYGIENKIWAGLGPVGNMQKNFGADYEQLFRAASSCFHGQKIGLIFFEIILASALKRKVRKHQKIINFKYRAIKKFSDT